MAARQKFTIFLKMFLLGMTAVAVIVLPILGWNESTPIGIITTLISLSWILIGQHVQVHVDGLDYVKAARACAATKSEDSDEYREMVRRGMRFLEHSRYPFQWWFHGFMSTVRCGTAFEVFVRVAMLVAWPLVLEQHWRSEAGG